MDEQFRLRLQSDLHALKRDLSRRRDKDFRPGSGKRRLDQAIQRIDSRINNLRQSWPSGYEPELYSGDMGMTEEMQKYDLNGDGVLDEQERRIMLEDMRRKMEDEDAQRDSIRKMAWFALIGLLLYPFGIFLADAFAMGTAAQLIADIAPTYFASIAVLVSAFFGASALGAKKKEGG